MQFKFYIGTKVIFGSNCIRDNKDEFNKWGRRCLIVTGRNSGKVSGALDDIENTLSELRIGYQVFNDVCNNPSLEHVGVIGSAARQFKADFIVGIGGGSPLDASKAAAVLAVNTIEPIDLYKNIFNRKPLPVIAIPTTAGTGSEVTPYSILTRNDMQTKMSFGNEDTCPVCSFLDAGYTTNLPYDITVNTAVDALSHAVEGYLSKRSTMIIDIFALEAVRLFGECIESILSRNIDYYARERLMYAALLGGMTISHTGTTICHGMGYSLTFFKNIPHGKANGILMKEYLEFNYDAASERINNLLKLLKMRNIEEFGKLMDMLLPKECSLDNMEIEKYASLAMKQKSTSYNIKNVTEKNMVEIYTKALGTLKQK